MSLVLGVTSSTAAVGVAIGDGAAILAAHELLTDRRHAEELTPMIAAALADANVALGDIEKFAVDIGPGRFTGLRVGMTTVRMLAFAQQRPVVGISSLELLARAVWEATPDAAVCAVIDARRHEVFQQRFGGGENTAAIVGPASDLAHQVREGDVVIGDGADRYHHDYADLPAVTFVPEANPSAATLARCAATRDGVEGPLVLPLYLREPDVQINIKTRHNS